MEKKKYEGMEMEVVEFEAEDVITASGGNGACLSNTCELFSSIPDLCTALGS